MEAKSEDQQPTQTAAVDITGERPVFGLSNEARPGSVPWTARRTLAGLALAGAGLVAVSGIFAAALGLGLAGASGQTDLIHAGTAVVATVISDLLTVGLAWWLSLHHFGLPLASWGLRRPKGGWLGTVGAGFGAAYAVSLAYSALAHPPQQQILRDFPHTAGGVTLFAILAIVCAPALEEAFFRGFLFQGFASSWGPCAGAVVSAAVFASVHLQPSVFVPIFALGLALAYVFWKTGSLYASIALHAAFNAVSVVLWAASG